jgi:hypothetical protein
MRWRDLGYDHKQFHDDKGRIWGEVIRPAGSSDYLASYNGAVVGPYIDMRSAQIAIERTYREAHRKPRKPKPAAQGDIYRE